MSIYQVNDVSMRLESFIARVQMGLDPRVHALAEGTFDPYPPMGTPMTLSLDAPPMASRVRYHVCTGL